METRVVEVPGRLDSANADDFGQLCYKTIGVDAVELVFDCGQVAYVSSAGLRIILAVGKELMTRGGAIELRDLGGMARQIFELSGFLTLFPHRP